MTYKWFFTLDDEIIVDSTSPLLMHKFVLPGYYNYTLIVKNAVSSTQTNGSFSGKDNFVV